MQWGFSKLQRGQWSEWLAAAYLFCRGYRVLQRNYRGRYAEVDILAQQRQTLIIIEVKFRQQQRQAHVAIHPQQQQRLLRQAQAMQGFAGTSSVRVDVVLIYPHWPWLEHHKNAL